MASDKLRDKSIVIVGGTSGLGLSAARACCLEGANVVVVGRNEERCGAAVAENPGQMRAVVGDASLANTAERAIADAAAAFGNCHALYHVAGGSGRSLGDGPLGSISDQGWDQTLRLNLDSVFYSNRAAIQYWMHERTSGVILNMASVLGFDPSPHYFATHAYAASKAAIIGLSKSAAAYYAAHNIRINAIAPALVDTPMARRAVQDQEIMRFIATKQPLDGGRVGQASDLDAAVVFLLSDESRFITGQVLAIDGGWCVSDGQIPRRE